LHGHYLKEGTNFWKTNQVSSEFCDQQWLKLTRRLSVGSVCFGALNWKTLAAGVACDQQPVAGLLKRWTLPSSAETVDIDHSLGKCLRGFLRQIVTDPTG
jgi:hypothetical protein